MAEPLSKTQKIDGGKLRTERTRRGYSQQSLADRVGISRGYLADMERGRKSNPRALVVSEIALALGIDARALWTDSDDT